MEFDIGTLIYIIITIVAIVAGTLNKKKPARKVTSGDQEEKAPGFFERLEQEIGGLVDETKQSLQSVAEDVHPAGQVIENEAVVDDIFSEDYQEEPPIETASKEYSKYEGVLDQDAIQNQDLLNMEEVRTADDEKMIEVIDVDEYVHANYFEIVKEFDLGTAVIYSTIINRPEY